MLGLLILAAVILGVMWLFILAPIFRRASSPPVPVPPPPELLTDGPGLRSLRRFIEDARESELKYARYMAMRRGLKLPGDEERAAAVERSRAKAERNCNRLRAAIAKNGYDVSGEDLVYPSRDWAERALELEEAEAEIERYL